MWVLAVITASVASGPSPDRVPVLALGLGPLAQGHLWVLWTSGLFASGWVHYVLASVLILAVAVPVEYRIGSRRFLLAVVLCQGAGSVLALLVARAAAMSPNSWGSELHRHTCVDPMIWIIGALAAATASMSTLWRRRIRAILLVFLATAALFAGHLQDLTRFTAAVAGVLLGPILVGRAVRSPSLGGTIRERRTLIALVVAASILGPVFAAVSAQAIGPLSVLRELFDDVPFSPQELRDICADPALREQCREGDQALRLSGLGPAVMNLMPSVVLLAGAEGLRRGRYAGWLVSTYGYLLLTLVAAASLTLRINEQDHTRSLLYGTHPHDSVSMELVPLAALLMILVLLWATRSLFDVHAPRGTYRKVWLGTGAATGAVLVLYPVAGLLLAEGFDPVADINTLMRDAPRRLVPPVYLQLIESPIRPVSSIATVLFEWLGVLPWLVFALLIVRSFLTLPRGLDPGGTLRVRQLLHTPGGTCLSWMTTWQGNRYWFSADGHHAVAYRVYAGVALTTGEPLGDRTALPQVIDEFAAFCLTSGWTPCFYTVGAETAQIGRAHGWRYLQVAEETVIDPRTVAFTGKKFQDVRTALNRAAKEGIEARWTTFAEAPLSIIDQIVSISEEWVADKGLPEMGFTLGGVAELRDPEVRVLLAVDRDEHVHAVTSWLPVYRDGAVVGLTLDFMRRRSGGFRTAMEFLIASAAKAAHEQGLEVLSLSGAPLARANEGEPDGDRSGLDAVLELLGRTLEPVYGFRSLLAFKAKFQPQYRPLYMVFPDATHLPAIGVALTRAYLPYLSLEQSGRLMARLLRR
ncbi:phosphatidylglycerol lysyltransferase domain-containing protein [Rhodococcus rhodochrous]|uniref:bifunctional lysylphosphatidylglycerol flippase/synthetase MprF n=1 Tax=Rhodococcus rhodochrous TaxID=1829 RepID=UPI00035EE391